jgi:hypothetical protein
VAQQRHEVIGLGEETSPVSATVRMDVVQGLASSIVITVADTLVINQVSGALVSDWEFRPGTLKVNFLEPIGAQTSFGISGEARVAREGSVPVPLVRLPGAERGTGGVAVGCSARVRFATASLRLDGRSIRSGRSYRT